MTVPRRDLAAMLSERHHEWTPFLPPLWYGDALCAQTDAEAFFPEQGGRGRCREAKQVCAACPVREQCLEWALDNHEAHGVWGGHTERERRKLARQRKAAA